MNEWARFQEDFRERRERKHLTKILGHLGSKVGIGKVDLQTLVTSAD